MADDKKIKFSKEEINNAKEFSNAFRNVNDEVNALFSSLNSVSDEIKGQVQGYQLANKAVNNLTGIFGKVKDILANKIVGGGIAISFGWSSGGFGKNRGFEIEEILLVPHGGHHYDTIVVVERKVIDLFNNISKTNN